MSEFGTGFIDRDFDAEPFASVIPEYSGQTYPRDVWREMISEQDKRKCSPYHAFRSAKCPIFSQAKTNYCWCFGLVQGVAVALAQSGYDESPPLHLSGSLLMPVKKACLYLQRPVPSICCWTSVYIRINPP